MIDGRGLSTVELCDVHKRQGGREGGCRRRGKRLDGSGSRVVGVAFWEGQTSRGQECTFSSFARSPTEYKFATLSPWRERYPRRSEFPDTRRAPEDRHHPLRPLRMDFEVPRSSIPPRIPITRLPIYSSWWKIIAALFATRENGRVRSISEQGRLVRTAAAVTATSSTGGIPSLWISRRFEKYLYVRTYVIVSRCRGYARRRTFLRIKRGRVGRLNGERRWW